LANITAYHGDTVEWIETITDRNGVIDLTTAVVRVMLKRTILDDDADALIELSTATSGITIVGDPEDGVVSVEVPPEATSGLDNKKQTIRWEMQVEAGERRWTVDSGKWIVLPELIQA